MKKILLSMLAIASFVGANAQIQFGAEAGLVMSNVSGIDGSKSKTGAKVGAIVDIPFSDNFGLQPGLFYSMMGTKVDDATLAINYIQIPINLIYKLGEPGGNRLFFAAGPQLGYCLGGKESGGPFGDHTLKVGTGEDADVKPIDMGIDVNVGYQLSMGLLFRVGYYAGLAKINPTTAPGAKDNKNSAIMISVGWLF